MQKYKRYLKLSAFSQKVIGFIAILLARNGKMSANDLAKVMQVNKASMYQPLQVMLQLGIITTATPVNIKAVDARLVTIGKRIETLGSGKPWRRGRPSSYKLANG